MLSYIRAFIGFILPPVVFFWIDRKINQRKHLVFSGAMFFLVLNICGGWIDKLRFGQDSSALSDLLSNGRYFISYSVINIVLGCGIVFLLYLLGVHEEDRSLTFHINDKAIAFAHLLNRMHLRTWQMWLFAAVCMGVHIFRSFDNNFWGDEAFTIKIVQMSVPDLIRATAGDVHPPLYYLIVKGFCTVLGNHPVVYHFASVFPYIAGLILAITVISRLWGKAAGVLFIAASSIFHNCIVYNVEVRMYSWCAFFALAAVISLYAIIRSQSICAYVGFTLGCLGMGYTHYYGLLGAGILYVCLLFVTIGKKGKWKRSIASAVIMTAAYLPWLLPMAGAVGRSDTAGSKIYNVSMEECIDYLYEGVGNHLYLFLSITLTAVILLKGTGILRIHPTREGGDRLSIHKPCGLDGMSSWLLCMLALTSGTILTGTAVSAVATNVLLGRYLYPISLCSLLVLSVVIPRAGVPKTFIAIFLCVMIVLELPYCIRRTISDYRDDRNIQRTLAATSTQMDNNAVILSQNGHLEWTINGYYYPDLGESITVASADDLAPNLADDGRIYWFYDARDEMNDKLQSSLSQKGYLVTEIVRDGCLGGSNVDVYRLEKQ